MSHYKHEAKSAYHDKIKRMGLHKEQKDAHFTDTEPYDGVPYLDSGQTGAKPIGKQRFKRGGKVAHLEGHKAKHHLGHKPRTKKNDGGPLMQRDPNAPINQDVSTGGLRIGNRPVMSPTATRAGTPMPMPPVRPSTLGPRRATPVEPPATTQFNKGGRVEKAVGGPMANPALRKKMVGAMLARKRKAGLPAPNNPIVPSLSAPMLTPRKSGGRTEHPDVAEDKKLIKSMVKPSAMKHREEHCWGGRAKRATGGKVGKGKTNISINVNPPQPQQPAGGINPLAGMLSGGNAAPTPVNPMAALAGAMGPAAGGLPPAGAGPGLGAMGAMNPGGGMGVMSAPVPPMRKEGGRVNNKMPKYQEDKYGSGSGLGRLEKTHWPLPK